MNVDEVLQEILEDHRFYSDSGGGVTISGGEPFCQPEFTIELLKTCDRLNIHTAVETKYGLSVFGRRAEFAIR